MLQVKNTGGVHGYYSSTVNQVSTWGACLKYTAGSAFYYVVSSSTDSCDSSTCRDRNLPHSVSMLFADASSSTDMRDINS